MNNSFSQNSGYALRKYMCEVRSRDNPNELKQMVIEAYSKDDCVQRCIDQGYLVVSVKRPGQAEVDAVMRFFSAGTKGGGGGGKSNWMQMTVTTGVTTRELIFFAVQLSTLLKAGIPLIRSLDIVRKGTPNPYFRTALGKLKDAVSGGSAFSVALKGQGRIFPWLWSNLVEVGEATGKLPECLEEIAKYQESSARIRTKVITAFFYPGILSCAVVGALSFLLIYIVPKFAAIFEQQHMRLPALTQVVVNISNIVRNQAYLLLLALIPVFILIYFVKTSAKVRRSFDYFRLKFPVFGKLLMEISVVRFSRSLSTLLKSGVQILQALDIGGRLVENAYIETNVKQIAKNVRSGQGLGAQLEVRKIFPVFMTQLVTVGEETGQIDKFLDLIAVFYEERVDAFLARLTTMLEPIMLLIMGGIIGTIVIAMFLPIIEISTRGGFG